MTIVVTHDHSAQKARPCFAVSCRLLPTLTQARAKRCVSQTTDQPPSSVPFTNLDTRGQNGQPRGRAVRDSGPRPGPSEPSVLKRMKQRPFQSLAFRGHPHSEAIRHGSPGLSEPSVLKSMKQRAFQSPPFRGCPLEVPSWQPRPLRTLGAEAHETKTFSKSPFPRPSAGGAVTPAPAHQNLRC